MSDRRAEMSPLVQLALSRTQAEIAARHKVPKLAARASSMPALNLTPAQHRAAARKLAMEAQAEYVPSVKARLEQRATMHEALARMPRPKGA